MAFALTDEQRMIQDGVRAFVKTELQPHEELVERLDAVPDDLFDALRRKAIDAGYYALNMPEEHGGGGLNASQRAVAEVEFGRVSRALGIICNRPAPILKSCVGDQIDTYLKPTIRGERWECFALTEPGAGSDARAIATRAVSDGDDYVVNGTKQFITMAMRADFIILFAVTGVEGTPSGERKRITAFLVDKATPGITVTPLDVLSNRGMKSCIISFEDVRVPACNILGEEGGGFEIAKAWIFSGRVMLAANCVGLAERAMGVAAEWANTRHAFGQPIGRYQGTAFKLADMATEIHATRLLVLDAAAKMDAGTITQREASQVNLFGSEMVGRATDNAIQILGGMGVTKDMPLERFWRDARVERIWEGTSEIHRDIISKDVLREYRGMSAASRIRQEVEGRILVITFDHPPAHAFDQQASRDLDAALTRLNDDPELRCAIVTATGDRMFSAGWDLKAVAAGETGEDFGPHGFMGLRRSDLLKPVICAVNGLAVGGGFEFALAATIVLAVPHAEFGLPEVQRGFIPEAGGLWRGAPQTAGQHRLRAASDRPAADGRGRPAPWLRQPHRARRSPDGRGAGGRRQIIAAAAPLAVGALLEVTREVEALSDAQAFERLRSGLPAHTRMRQSEDFKEGPARLRREARAALDGEIEAGPWTSS